MPFNWTCPFCQRDTTITPGNEDKKIFSFTKNTVDDVRFYSTHFIVCPNPVCQKCSFSVTLYSADGDGMMDKILYHWRLIPSTDAMVFPDYVPEAVINDYNEACAIRDLSPKASATLARRCLQGIIRDFWGVQGRTLFDEINEIEGRVDPITWEAINAVRKLGNIGAHMERDIGIIIDVEPEEAQLLIGLIETLIKEWYVARYERQQRMAGLIDLARRKDQLRQP